MGILKIKDVAERFDCLQALSDVNISGAENTYYAIGGPKGAGK